MARTLGSDLVGMSTALEAIAAREMGMEIGISLVTNLAAGVASEKLDHSEVLEAGKAAGPRIPSFSRTSLNRLRRICNGNITF